MNHLTVLTSSPYAEAAGFALVHFLWMGTLAGLACAAVLHLLTAHSPRIRYAVACSSLLLMAAIPLVTFWIELPAPGSAARRIAMTAHSAAAPIPPPAVELTQPLWLPAVLMFWFGGILFFGVRAAGGWWMVHLRMQARTLAPQATIEKIQRLEHRMGLDRAIRIFESAELHVPEVFGAMRPMILLPLTAMTGLSPAQWEAVLAHELAHIARHDFLVNCLQTVVEVLLFYHPAVWWLSHRIRQERELCCDEMAVAVCQDRILYSRALLALEEHR